MFLFHKLYYIRLGNDENVKLDIESSVIELFLSKPRKIIYNNKIPLLSIHLPYTKGILPKEKQTPKVKTNQDFVNQAIQETLESAQPFTRIYIDAHGNSDSSYIYQKTIDDNAITITKITAKQIATILNGYLPFYAKNNLQIMLVVCEAEKFSRKLIDHLTAYGFKNTSVIFYHDVIKLLLSNSENRLHQVLPNTGKTTQKSAFHNYNSSIELISYNLFKQQYMNNAQYDRISSQEIGCSITQAQEKLLYHKNCLIRLLSPIIANYCQSRENFSMTLSSVLIPSLALLFNGDFANMALKIIYPKLDSKKYKETINLINGILQLSTQDILCGDFNDRLVEFPSFIEINSLSLPKPFFDLIAENELSLLESQSFESWDIYGYG